MKKSLWVLALAVTVPLASLPAQALSPTDGGVWQVSCAQIGSPLAGDCLGGLGTFMPAVRVDPIAGGWASPVGGAYWISVLSSGSLSPSPGNENPNFDYIFRTKFDVVGPAVGAINLNMFYLDNYWGGWRLNGSGSGGFNPLDISPTPADPNDPNWTQKFTLSLTGLSFKNGENYLDLWIQGNGQTDAIMATGSYQLASTPETTVPEPATMTLLATGLVGMLGAGLRRRRKA